MLYRISCYVGPFVFVSQEVMTLEAAAKHAQATANILDMDVNIEDSKGNIVEVVSPKYPYYPDDISREG